MVLQSYYRLEAWAEDLLRLKFAITIGIASFFGVFAVGLLFRELTTVHAVMMGVAMAIVYYAFDPREAHALSLEAE
ncbi:hypothetical protein ACFQE1_02470 [Halobium palmae]|uniref:Uncharacterized protein n=1 Tax=Halobium palmae TaxID=1776492 RepID=A0ABD5RVK3_9EURY